MEKANNISVDTFNLLEENGLKLPLFTGFFNGLGIEVKSLNEMSVLYQWSCFGKGSFSRSKPTILNRSHDNCPILRKRQFLKREEWVKKFDEKRLPSANEKLLQNDIEKLMNEIKESHEGSKDVIDLVSSDEDMEDIADVNGDASESMPHIAAENVAIVVPNSDSEGEDYFKDFKPKCCFNKVNMEEYLVLTLQEAYFLSYAFGCLQIINFDKNPLSLEQSWKLFVETEQDFVVKYIVYHYFRSKGYIVKPGIKFGGDYLLYKEGPGRGHADYVVVIRHAAPNVGNQWLPILGHIRMAATTSKDILIADVVPYPKSKQDISPKDLYNYSVRETIWTRRIPYNEDD